MRRSGDLPAWPETIDYETLAQVAAHNGTQCAFRGGKHFLARYERMRGKGQHGALVSSRCYLSHHRGPRRNRPESCTRDGRKRRPPHRSGQRRRSRMKRPVSGSRNGISGSVLRIFSADTADQSRGRGACLKPFGSSAALKGASSIWRPSWSPRSREDGWPRGPGTRDALQGRDSLGAPSKSGRMRIGFLCPVFLDCRCDRSAGARSYAAANAYVEALGRYRRAREAPGTKRSMGNLGVYWFA